MDDGDSTGFLEPGRRIVIRLVEPTPVDVDDLLRLDSPLAGFLRENRLASERLVRGIPPEQILDLEREEDESERHPRYSLTAYWLLDATDAEGELDELVAAVARVPDVAEAYPLPGLAVASALPNDPLLGNQQYLTAATAGIDAEWAWQLQPPRTGAGVRFVDIELGWQSPHDDVPAAATAPVGGTNTSNNTRAFHGLANLGVVVAATNNAIGVAGAAPGVTQVTLASANYSGVPNFASAMTAALLASSPGDVLLIELQTIDGYPVETTSADLTAILTATNSVNRRVVVEAAGDGPSTGAVDLGTILGATDSGAIVVGAGASAFPHGRISASNHGTRVDCYAWGENVFTTGGIGTSPTAPAPAQNAPNRYTNDYAGTSSAAAIVAGAALLVQGAYKASALGARTSVEMRALLNGNGTPCVAGDGIGTMPDLRKILPDVYIRDDLPDDGTVPSTGGLSVSPDVIVTTAPVANPAATYGAGSANENVNTLGEQVEAGQDNYVYARMKNRGSGVADGTTATVHYSPAATLVNPGAWTLIGTTPPVNVGPGLTVAGPIVWASADIPATGHYCFIARVNHPLDTAPPAPTGSITAFVDYIRNNNNVAWRNFNVVDVLPNVLMPMVFLVAGAFDRERPFALHFVPRLLRGVEIWFEAPQELIRLVPQGVLPDFELDGELVRLRLPDDGLRIPRLLLPRNAKYRCRLLVRAEGLSDDHEPPTLAIRQFLGETEVGRLTWALRAARESY